MPVAVLLMAYGTPDTPEAVEPYYTHIRGGRPPSAEAVANLRARYERVGGTTPLLALTRAVQDRLAERFAAVGEPRPVYVGMKHGHPYIAVTVMSMSADGVRQATAIVLAPHYSRISIGGYRKYLEQANAELATPVDVRLIERWGAEPEFIAMMATLVQEGLAQFDGSDVTVVFTAHSLPVRIREWQDPDESELLESSRLAAEAAGVTGWRFAWQSAGATGEPWIGPDILEYLGTLAAEGVRNVLQVPIGFVADHLEVLYDIDVEARERAAELGMTLRRTQLPNADPRFIDVLATVIRRAEAVPAGIA
jgi:ferrochelatase